MVLKWTPQPFAGPHGANGHSSRAGLPPHRTRPAPTHGHACGAVARAVQQLSARGSGRRSKARPHGPAGERGDGSAREGPALFGSFSRSGRNDAAGKYERVCARRRTAAKYRCVCQCRRGGAERGGTQQSPWFASRSHLFDIWRGSGQHVPRPAARLSGKRLLVNGDTVQTAEPGRIRRTT